MSKTEDTLESLALELAAEAGESDWRAVGIQRDIDSPSEKWLRWSSIPGWSLPLAARVDKFISTQRALIRGNNNTLKKV